MEVLVHIPIDVNFGPKNVFLFFTKSAFTEVWAETGENFLPNNKWLGVKGCWLS